MFKGKVSPLHIKSPQPEKKANYILNSPNANTNANAKSPNNNYPNLDTKTTASSSHNPTCTYPFCNCYNCKINIQTETAIKQNQQNINKQNINKNAQNPQNPQNINYITPEKPNKSYNPNTINQTDTKKKSNLSSVLDNCYKEHLKSGLQSVMKRDFNNQRIETNESFVPKENLNDQKGSPFLGRSINSINYPEYLISPKRKGPYISEDLLKIPFSGSSSYQETFEKFDDRYYQEKLLPFLKKDNLETIGNFITETTSKNTYKNMFTDKNENNGSLKKRSFKDVNSFSIMGINPPGHKDDFLSQYKRAYLFDKENKVVNINKFNRGKV
jgi:hypothetical protein